MDEKFQEDGDLNMYTDNALRCRCPTSFSLLPRVGDNVSLSMNVNVDMSTHAEQVRKIKGCSANIETIENDIMPAIFPPADTVSGPRPYRIAIMYDELDYRGWV